MPETRISDYAAFLRDLGASKADYFLGGGQAVNFTQRALINELKLLKAILKLQKVRQALQNIGTDPATLFPAKQLRSCGLATVEAFASSSLKGES